MPRGKRKKVDIEENFEVRDLREKSNVEEDVSVEPMKRVLTKEDVLKNAKVVGVFNYNKKFKQYEIILSIDEYEKL